MAKILNTLSDSELISTLLDGGVGVMPTDTIYGLVCRAADERSVARLYGLKHREIKPGTIIAADVNQLVELGIKKRYLTAVEQFWAYPISVVIPIGHGLSYLHLGKMSLACRVAAAPKELISLLSKTGPLLTSSANLPGQPQSNNMDMAQAYFGDSVDFYVDCGDRSGVAASTVIRVVDDAIEILRIGATNINENGKVV
ncbi:MAG: Sua5/YciO/YrdC/YwlC family protein [Candidatus Saccharimonadales bacterium]